MFPKQETNYSIYTHRSFKDEAKKILWRQKKA